MPTLFRMPNLLCLAILEIALCSAARAALDQEHKPKNLYFILNGTDKPAHVTEELAGSESGKVMRLPDLGNTSSVSASSPHNGRSKIKTDDTKHEENNEEPQLAEASAEESVLEFKVIKVSGKSKFPRVRFSQFEPTVELREETPSLDFTGKSLKDGGF